MRITLVNYIDEVEKRVKKWLIAKKKNLCLKILNKNIECLKEPLLNAWDKFLFFDPSINKKKNNKKTSDTAILTTGWDLRKKVLEPTTTSLISLKGIQRKTPAAFKLRLEIL